MLFSLLTDRRKTAYGVAFALLLAWMVGIVALVVKTGCSHQDDTAWDTVFLLDGAYRLHAGQVPHVDFHSPVGVFPFWLVSVGMTLGGVNANAIAYGMALGFLGVTVLAWGVCARRFSAFFAFALSLLIGGLFIATRPMSFGLLWYAYEFAHASYAMGYNRIGWALLCILAAISLLAPRNRGAKGWDDAEAFLAGCLTILLALTKVNYLAAAVGIGLGGMLVTRGGWRRCFWYAAGLAAIPAALWATTSFSFGAYFGDIAAVGRLADRGERFLRIVQVFAGNLPAFLSVAAVFWLLAPFCRGKGEGSTVRLALICAGCAAIGWMVLALNMQWSEVPLLAVACAIVLETALRGGVPEPGPGNASFRLRFLTGSALFVYLAGGTFLNDTASVGYSWALKNHVRHLIPDSGILQSASLGPLFLPPQGGEEVDKAKVETELLERRNLSRAAAGRLSLTPYQYAHLVNDGLALLRPNAVPESRVFCLDLVNPFSVALSLPPPKGGTLWWDRMTFNRQIFPAPERVFADVTQVMIPKSGLNTQALQEIYLPYVMAHFRHVGESALWDLYVRKKPSE